MAGDKNRYTRIIAAIFSRHYRENATEVPFDRSDISQCANELGIRLPKNLGDILYSFRYRARLPQSIAEKAPEGYEWVIRSTGRGRYQFALAPKIEIAPSPALVETKIPDATPGVISLYSLNDEQALLAKIRYNRLIDVFTGLTCYSLQNHLRTTVAAIGQVETDELYIGIDKRGVHYVLPVQAKGKADKVGVVQIEQDMAVCATKFPSLLCKPIAAQSVGDNTIALFELEQTGRETLQTGVPRGAVTRGVRRLSKTPALTSLGRICQPRIAIHPHPGRVHR
jgi:hypothetical protein